MEPSQDHFIISPTSYGGRGCFASRPLASDYLVHCVENPFSSVVFREFRKEVCAFCFEYDLGRAMKIRLQYSNLNPQNSSKPNQATSPSAPGGLWFCSEECKNDWLIYEDGPQNDLLSVLDSIDHATARARRSMQSGKGPAATSDIYDADFVPPDFVLESTSECQLEVNKIWRDIETKISPDSPIRLNPIRNPMWQLRILALEDVEHDTARLVATALVKLAREQVALQCGQNVKADNSWVKFLNLESHELDLLVRVPDLLESHIRVYLALKIIMPSQYQRYVTSDNFRAVVSKEAANAFGIWQLPLSQESECLGSSIFPSASYFNHSCSPNIVKLRKGRQMHFRTTRPIKPGEELCISYGMILEQPIEVRQQLLKTNWYFVCGCNRCSEELSSDSSTDTVSDDNLESKDKLECVAVT
ncbi:uncharacterized protein V1516DRAFT_664023 [Lipomyces oligophaga]|uniref:uncharacterized protein n=1 Tax=Lipomyces oligophaga TaxID=45792 RepID=UPI0034CFB465